MKRKGETLTEFLTAVTVFGLMAAGIFEFIANQTENLADIKNKDEMMYYANWCIAAKPEEARGNSQFTDDDNKVRFTPDGGQNLTVTLLTEDGGNRASMTFSLKP